MAAEMNRGEIWLHTFKSPDKQRPVVILTRNSAIPWLRSVMVAPITSVIRGAPGEVAVGLDEGLKTDSVVNLDHVQTVSKRRLHHFIGTLGPEKERAICRALAIATGCG